MVGMEDSVVEEEQWGRWWEAGIKDEPWPGLLGDTGFVAVSEVKELSEVTVACVLAGSSWCVENAQVALFLQNLV